MHPLARNDHPSHFSYLRGSVEYRQKEQQEHQRTWYDYEVRGVCSTLVVRAGLAFPAQHQLMKTASECTHNTTMSKRRERTSYADGCNGRLASFVGSAIYIGMPASIAFFSAHFPTSTQHKLCEQLQHRLCTLSRRGVDIGSPGRVSWLRVKF